MIHEYRVYDIAEGKMDQWIDVFKNTIIPIHQALGVSIPEAWRHDESNEFIWVRTARDADHMDEIHKAVTSDPEVLGQHPHLPGGRGQGESNKASHPRPGIAHQETG